MPLGLGRTQTWLPPKESFWRRAFNTISTDDAYVNGHVTFVAARVPGQVVKVMVEDNNAVHEGDLLVALDKKPRLRLR